MAQYKHLPIYKAVYDMLLRVMQVVKDFPRDYRYSIGEKIQNEATELVICIYKANSSTDKSDDLHDMLQHIQLLYLFLRISHDLQILPREKYVQIVEMVDNISRQTNGWLNKSGKVPEPEQATV